MKRKKKDKWEDRETYVEDSHGRRVRVNLKCKADICLTPDGRVIVDMTNTNCPPEKSKVYFERILQGQDTQYIMPKLKDRSIEQIAWCEDCESFATTSCFKSEHNLIYQKQI